MSLYTVTEAAVALITLFYLSLRTKKSTDTVYTTLDRIGIVTNLLLLAVYLCLSPIYLFLGMISTANYDGFLGDGVDRRRWHESLHRKRSPSL